MGVQIKDQSLCGIKNSRLVSMTVLLKFAFAYTTKISLRMTNLEGACKFSLFTVPTLKKNPLSYQSIRLAFQAFS